MKERDPRVDSMPGDVLQHNKRPWKRYIKARGLLLGPQARGKHDIVGYTPFPEFPFLFSATITDHRKWAKNAHVIQNEASKREVQG